MFTNHNLFEGKGEVKQDIKLTFVAFMIDSNNHSVIRSAQIGDYKHPIVFTIDLNNHSVIRTVFTIYPNNHSAIKTVLTTDPNNPVIRSESLLLILTIILP